MVKIVTDSTADLPKDLVDKYEIHVIPLNLFFGEETFKDGIDLSPEAFIQKLKASDKLPTTSQPSPADFAEMYKELIEDGSEVVSIHISSELSGTYQSAVLGREMLDNPEKVFVMDSLSATVGLGLMAIEAAKAAGEGKPGEAVKELVEKMIKGSHLFLSIETLEYLQKGGRIGRAQGMLGSLLNIKPILYLDEKGVVSPAEKVRGHNKAMKRMVDIGLEKVEDPQKVIFGVAHIGYDKGAEVVVNKAKEKYPDAQYIVYEGGPVIGTHVGPKTVGFIVQNMN